MLQEIFANIDGAVDVGECLLLYELASRVQSGCIIEIGSYRGRSTVTLALGSLAGHRVPVFAVDPHEEFVGILGGRFGPRDRAEFLRNILAAEVTEIVRLVNLSCEVVAPGWSKPVELLWIDGDHGLDGVVRDFNCWEPHVVSGGTVAFHDSVDANLGPSKVITCALESDRFEIKCRLGLTTVLKKMVHTATRVDIAKSLRPPASPRGAKGL
jgi:hypothetical protein